MSRPRITPFIPPYSDRVREYPDHLWICPDCDDGQPYAVLADEQQPDDPCPDHPFTEMVLDPDHEAALVALWDPMRGRIG
jgi:hypothetical protein